MANARLLMAPPAIRKTHQCCIFYWRDAARCFCSQKRVCLSRVALLNTLFFFQPDERSQFRHAVHHVAGAKLFRHLWMVAEQRVPGIGRAQLCFHPYQPIVQSLRQQFVNTRSHITLDCILNLAICRCRVLCCWLFNFLLRNQMFPR